jgi:hypothetical protein
LIERAIENWLTSTNEKGYEVPFCQCLISEGYTILGLSFHGPVEQGKDIIALDERSNPCAFQLKTGDINERVWRDIKGEIDELVEIPIKHPNVDPKAGHRCILVTNGAINDIVRTNIADRNRGFREKGLPELEIIQCQQLLKMFLDVNGAFLPRQISDFKKFLELFTFDGNELLNKGLFASFLESVLLTGGESRAELKRKIASSVLLTQYLLATYESRRNHISIIEGWTVLSSYILYLVEKYELSEADWAPSLNLVLERLNYQASLLKAEFLSRKDYIEPWDCALFYKARVTLVLGWLAAYELCLKKLDKGYVADKGVYRAIKKAYARSVWFWGESATPLFVMMSMLADQAGDQELSNKIICDLIIGITNRNNFGEKNCLPDPYYSSRQVIDHFYGPPEARIDLNSFSGSSYHLAVLVDILVRRNQRNLLTELWKGISYILKSEFKPTSTYELLRWRCHEGKEVGGFFENPQSWKKLRENAYKLDDSEKLKTLLGNAFCYYFVVCFPQRLNTITGKSLDL